MTGSATSPPAPSAQGLDGLVVADTVLSEVNGQAGVLLIRGTRVEDLARGGSFEEAVCGLRAGLAEGAPAPADVQAALGRARSQAFELLPHLGRALAAPDGMDALRAAVAQLPPDGPGDPPEDLRLAGALAVFAAAWARRQAGDEPHAPNPDAPHAQDFLRCALGAEPRPEQVLGLERYLITVCDHGFNASTFTARVVASTQSDTVSAIVSAICALKGPAHGGAPGPVLDMLDAIGTPDRAEAWIESELDQGRRIMGMGHRVYKVRCSAASASAPARATTSGTRWPRPRRRTA